MFSNPSSSSLCLSKLQKIDSGCQKRKGASALPFSYTLPNGQMARQSGPFLIVWSESVLTSVVGLHLNSSDGELSF